MKSSNPGHAIRYTPGNKRKNIPRKPVLPTPAMVAVLRRASRGYVIVTMIEGKPDYSYEDGAPVSLTDKEIATVIKEGWLVPDENDSLLPEGPPQIYRARRL